MNVAITLPSARVLTWSAKSVEGTASEHGGRKLCLPQLCLPVASLFPSVSFTFLVSLS